MKKLIALIVALVLTLSLSLTAASADGIKIAIPNDATNEGRALLLLQAYGLLKVSEDAGITATVAMIHATGITWQGCISFIAFNMLTIPCFAACATAKAELPKGKFKWTLLFWIATSFIGSAFIYCFLSMFSSSSMAWAIPVTLAMIFVVVSLLATIKIRNKRMA